VQGWICIYAGTDQEAWRRNLNPKNLHETLKEVLKGRTAFVGIGNVDFCDDGSGVRLAEALADSGLPDVLIARTVPENYVTTLAQGGYENVVLMDVVSTGAEPGSVVFLDSAEVKIRFPQISTHKLSLATLTQLIESESPARVWLLGIQPQSVKQGSGLSKIVETTLKFLKIILLDIFHQRRLSELEGMVS
jgi:hydrogenase maturation protease